MEIDPSPREEWNFFRNTLKTLSIFQRRRLVNLHVLVEVALLCESFATELALELADLVVSLHVQREVPLFMENFAAARHWAEEGFGLAWLAWLRGAAHNMRTCLLLFHQISKLSFWFRLFMKIYSKLHEIFLI